MIADYHVVYARESEHQIEVPARRLDHIQAWLGERLHRNLLVPDLSDRGLTFEGARLLVVDGQPVAQLVYSAPDRPHEPLALCISFGASGEGAVRTESRDGVRLALWRRSYT
jgi:anti-sigma factor RsiW